jgi:hypothetical protein
MFLQARLPVAGSTAFLFILGNNEKTIAVYKGV